MCPVAAKLLKKSQKKKKGKASREKIKSTICQKQKKKGLLNIKFNIRPLVGESLDKRKVSAFTADVNRVMN